MLSSFGSWYPPVSVLLAATPDVDDGESTLIDMI